MNAEFSWALVGFIAFLVIGVIVFFVSITRDWNKPKDKR